LFENKENGLKGTEKPETTFIGGYTAKILDLFYSFTVVPH
jgi:hypothetical protein